LSNVQFKALSDLYPFDDHFFELDGQRLHYVDEGQGDPILFVHGNPTWSFAWRRFISELSKTHRCIAVDHIGCGFSDQPQDYDYTLAKHISNLRRLTEHLDLRRTTLVAHDWGGAIGMGVAGQIPDRFSRLVLMNTAAFRSTAIPLRIALCRIPILGAIGVRGLNLFARAALRMAVRKRERMTAEVCRGYLAPYDSWAHRIATLRFVEDIPLSSSHPSYSALQKVEQDLTGLTHLPMLLVWGMRDWCFTPAFLEEFQQRFPNAECLKIEEASHYVFEDAHESVIPRIQQFLEATSTTPLQS